MARASNRVRGCFMAALLAILGTATFALAPTASAAPCLSGTQTFTFANAEECYEVPAGVTSLQVVAIGAPGGNGAGDNGGIAGAGANGARVSSLVDVTPGQVLYLAVGGAGQAGNGSSGSGGGFNGGGAGSYYPILPQGAGGGGGGATDLRTCSRSAGSCPGGVGSLSTRLLVAAGGGGGGGSRSASGGGAGGAGAELGAEGGDAGSASGSAPGEGGSGGTSATGGPAGPQGPGCGGTPAAAGTLGGGGKGGDASTGGGGGGGGYSGGGGGGGGCLTPSGGSGGGGGGSSFGTSGTTFAQDTSGVASVTITPVVEPVIPVPTTTPAPERGESTAERVAEVEGLHAALELTCPLQDATCKGVARLTARKALIGKKRFSIPADSSRKLRVKLTRKGRALLEDAPRNRLKAKLSGTNIEGRRVVLKQVSPSD